jgi:hypothetical protein
MFASNWVKSGTALVLLSGTIASASLPLISVNSASAQLFPNRDRWESSPEYPDRDRSDSYPSYPDRDRSDSYPTRRRSNSYSDRLVIRDGTRIPVRYERAEKIVVAPDETVPITLEVAANIRSRQGRVLIPAGTEVYGKLEPQDDGVQFVAREIKLDGDRVRFDAISEVVGERETVNRNNTGSILKGAVIGAGAATILAAVTGDRKIGLGEIIGGAGLGAVGGWVLGRNKKREVITIEPDRELELTLQSDLALR